MATQDGVGKVGKGGDQRQDRTCQDEEAQTRGREAERWDAGQAEGPDQRLYHGARRSRELEMRKPLKSTPDVSSDWDQC